MAQKRVLVGPENDVINQDLQHKIRTNAQTWRSKFSDLFKIRLANGSAAHRDETLLALAMFLPGFLVLVALGIFPIVNVLAQAFQRRAIFDAHGTWIGLENFFDILNNPTFWIALKNDILYTGISILLQTILGILVALLAHRSFFGRNFFRGFILLSYVVPTAAAAIIWRFMLSDSVGIVYSWIKVLNLPIPNTWFASPKTAMPAVIMITVWKFFPFMVINFLARLQIIDEQLYDAAKVDGANSWQTFRYITLPSLMPVIIIVLLLRTIWTFNNWEVIALLTNGGPVTSTTTLPILIYQTMFSQFSIGRAAAMAFLMMLFLLTTMYFYMRAYNRAEESLR
jgi:multiple sugar transport system permease protein